MKKHTQLTLALALAAGALFAGGCATTSAHYIDSTGANTVVSLNKINIQDFYQASDDMVADILGSGVLERAPSQPAIMKVTAFKNATTTNFEMSMLTQKVTASLMRTGKVSVVSEDQATNAYAGKQAFVSGKTIKGPYYTLSGKIIEDRASAGSIRQTSYIFQLNLATINDGLNVWQGEKTITKQGSKASVGW